MIITNPRWVDADNIDATAEHPIFGAIPITLSRHDDETAGLFLAAAATLPPYRKE